jgi:large subunit ribosomal protein L3
MNIQALIGQKIDQTQGFLEDGTRVPMSIISVNSNVVSQIKTIEHEGYNALQLGFSNMKRADKPTSGHTKKAGLEQAPRFFREVRVDETPDAALGSAIQVAEVFEVGDIVDVTGTSKGKGYAGVVKRHGFHGGPKTHGQSDRHRAPGASGQGTTPGRVYRGKKMSGRMGNEQVTVKNLEVLDIKDGSIFVRGLIPGSRGAIVYVKKVGKNKKFVPLWSEKIEDETPQEVTTAEEIVQTPEEKIETAQDTVATPEEKVETANDTVETPSEETQTEENQEVNEAESVEGEENANK